MKTKMKVSHPSPSHQRNHALFSIRLSKFLAHWRDRLGYMSMWAALPVLFGSEVTDARAPNVSDPKENNTERKMWSIKQQSRSRPGSEFLKRLSAYSRDNNTAALAQSTLIGGADNCPGQPIPAGNYTAAAPFTDNGTTVGASSTVNSVYCYYCNSPMLGPDVVYRFRLTATGPNPLITVVPTSENFDVKIYLLDVTYSGGCPSASVPYANDLAWMRSSDGRAISPDTHYLLNRPAYFFVDSPGDSGGSYTIQMQDVTLAEPKWPAVVSDFDGNYRSDSAVFRPSEGKWYLRSPSQVHSWGFASDKIAPADYDGDGVTDMAVYRPSEGKWYIVNSANSTIATVTFGLNGDVPQPQDFNGDCPAISRLRAISAATAKRSWPFTALQRASGTRSIWSTVRSRPKPGGYRKTNQFRAIMTVI